LIIQLAPEAVENLETTHSFLAARNPQAAARLVTRVFASIELLAEGSTDGPEMVLRTGERVRAWFVRPLWLYYVRETGQLLVLRLYHQGRRPLTRRRRSRGKR
jgi:plasmid stabilization system protein ParE